MEPHDAYSSSGPTYEQVANGNEQDHTCSILERNKITTDRHSNQLIAIDEEQSYHVVGREGVEGAGCDGVYSEASNYEVPMSSKTDSKVWLCEEEYSTLKHWENWTLCSMIMQNFDFIAICLCICVHVCLFCM